ncbi:hypothetical protein pEaSNUABM6_00116 [Erwinia phage pEa_SNUABM_6]|nr:hypothetical protein pEaSNUABM6_00116 [Erwinia phage pEa_SNUABM_6]
MTLLKDPTVKEIYSLPTVDGKYRYVFQYNLGDLTQNNIPRGITHKLVNSETGATLVSGRLFFCAPSWKHEDMVKKMLEEMKLVSARMFFKTVARKPDLLEAWKHHDLPALKGACERYVYVEEAINRFFADVMKTERLQRSPKDGQNYLIRQKSEERIRGKFGNYELSVVRRLELFGQAFAANDVRVTYELSPSLRVTTSESVSPGTLSFTLRYPLHEWPMLKAFFLDHRVNPVVTAWIENSWTEELRKLAMNKDNIDF